MIVPRYVIHVGPHKTGSTYLQGSFRKLCPKLLEHGALYPEFWCRSSTNSSHSLLAKQIADGNREVLSEQFKALNGSGHRLILISNEGLSRLHPDGVAMLKSLLDGASAEIVFYCRRWTELIPSSWQEHVKDGETLTLPEFVGKHLHNPTKSLLINYGRVLDRYTDAFGMESIRLVSYSLLRERRLDLVTHFARSFLGWADPPLGGLPATPNVSLSVSDIEMIRALNALDLRKKKRQGSRMRHAYLQSKRHLDVALPTSAMAEYITKLRLNDAASGVQDLYTALASRYGDRLVPPVPRRWFFPPRVSEIGFVHPDYLLERGVSDALGEIYEAICRLLPESTKSVTAEIAHSEMG